MANTNEATKVGVAAVAGAVVGALAGAAAVALSDPKNRRKVEGSVADLKKRGTQMMDKIQNQARDEVTEMQVKARKAAKKTVKKGGEKK